jgi:hypothetical protein
MEFLSYSYNSQTQCFELLYQDGDEQKKTEISVEMFTEMASVLPIIAEQKMAREILAEGYRIRKEQLHTIEEIAKKLKVLEKEHLDIRNRLQGTVRRNLTVTDKNEILAIKNEIAAIAAESKDLNGNKVILDTTRHITKQLEIRIMEARNKVQALEAGFIRE